ncbi:uncharacterized protein LOC111268176 isoform X4 [Varroa jacobsoni]|uniref:uncharacterized protein LOC111268176 isoform X4 n=1 Tax=Varroa jacobsoni TaxID=62625 RepID=UPI000BF7129F|nr:uncharacterized protein LOC111268176 isoform X4 [Varroa jacobsoni]
MFRSKDRFSCWRSRNDFSGAGLHSVQWLVVASILVTQSASSMTVSPAFVASSSPDGGQILPVQLSQMNCSAAIATCLKKSQNCQLVHHAYTLGCSKELQGRTVEGLCLDKCRLSLISLSSIIEGYEVITCSCARGDKECASMRNIENCWPERLDFNESEFERKRVDFVQQRLDYKHRLGEYQQKHVQAAATHLQFVEEPPYNPQVSCVERHRLCRENGLCQQAYVQYGHACRSTIEKTSEPCSAQCAASARVLYSVSDGGYFACICDAQTNDPEGEYWCRRQKRLIAVKCFGFKRAFTSGVALPVALSPILASIVPVGFVALVTMVIAPYR